MPHEEGSDGNGGDSENHRRLLVNVVLEFALNEGAESSAAVLHNLFSRQHLNGSDLTRCSESVPEGRHHANLKKLFMDYWATTVHSAGTDTHLCKDTSVILCRMIDMSPSFCQYFGECLLQLCKEHQIETWKPQESDSDSGSDSDSDSDSGSGSMSDPGTALGTILFEYVVKGVRKQRGEEDENTGTCMSLDQIEATLPICTAYLRCMLSYGLDSVRKEILFAIARIYGQHLVNFYDSCSHTNTSQPAAAAEESILIGYLWKFAFHLHYSHSSEPFIENMEPFTKCLRLFMISICAKRGSYDDEFVHAVQMFTAVIDHCMDVVEEDAHQGDNLSSGHSLSLEISALFRAVLVEALLTVASKMSGDLVSRSFVEGVDRNLSFTKNSHMWLAFETTAGTYCTSTVCTLRVPVRVQSLSMYFQVQNNDDILPYISPCVALYFMYTYRVCSKSTRLP